MEEGNLAILVDAKTEYTKQLVNILRNVIYKKMHDLFAESKLECKNDNTPNMVLNVFQTTLSQIPKWNQDIINDECTKIIEESKSKLTQDNLSDKAKYIVSHKIDTLLKINQ